MVYCIKLEELDEWVKNKAEPGDVAYYFDRRTEQSYLYSYKGQDDNPYWRLIFNETIIKYLVEEIDKLKVEDATVNKRCENCKYFKSIAVKDVAAGSWCEHEEHKGMYVPKFVSCPEYTPKEKKSTPFDGVKLYLIDDKSGELGIKYVCEDCGKLMDEPGHWWFTMPVGLYGKSSRNPGFHFRCEECDKKKEKES